MIDGHDFVKQAELDLRNTKTISEPTRQAWEGLPAEPRTAFAQAMAFLGGLLNGPPESPAITTTEADRIAASRLMLLKLGLDSSDPRWSSDVLDHLLKAVMETPDASVGDVLSALCGVLRDYRPELSKPVARLIKDVVVRCFTRYRSSYESVDWGQFVDCLAGNATPAQLYLALHAIPLQSVTPQLADAIAKGLEATAFRGEAESVLAV